MQIAVTAAHRTEAGALIQNWRGPCKMRLSKASELDNVLLLEGLRAGQRAADRAHELAHLCRSGKATRALGAAVAFIDYVGHRRGQISAYATRCGDIAQQRRLLEPAHVHGPLDDLTAP